MHNDTISLLQDILANHPPQQTALICEKQRLTYAQVDDMSNRLAQALRQQGVQDGDRILLYLMNGVELVVSIFAALKANAVFSVIDYATTFEALQFIAADCQAVGLITYQRQAENAAALVSRPQGLRFAVLCGADAEQPEASLLSFEALQERFAGQAPDLAGAAQGRIDCDLAYLIYTSGSTGRPKGVMVSHRSSLFTIRSGKKYLGLSDSVVHTSPLPLSFSPGINQLLQTFLVGGTLILERSFAFPTATLKRMEAERATGFAGVPTILTLLLQVDTARYDLSSLRYITSIGAALPVSLIQKLRARFPQVALYSTYGMAEASYSLGLPPEQIDRRPTSVGRPFPGTQAWVIDEQGQRLGPNQPGELVLRGGHVRSGYWNDPQRTALRFRPGPLPGEQVCHTGDIFQMDDEGYFYFLGRSDEVIKSGAKKVALREVENVLYSYEGVLEVAAIGIPDPILGLAVKALVTPAPNFETTLNSQDLLAFCQQKLETYKVPKVIEICSSLPKTPSGKIIKTDLN